METLGSADERPRPLPGSLGHLAPDLTYRSEKVGGVLYMPRPDLVVTQMWGRLDRGAAEAVTSLAERSMQDGISVRVFHDWERVTGYDSDARQYFTAYSLEWHRTIKGVVVLTQSKILAMGVAAVNLATSFVGVSMVSCTNRAAFERELLAAATPSAS